MTLNTDDTSVEIVEVLPKRQSWSPDANGNIRVSRFGFQLVPDFAGTIHSFVGTSLDAAMLDCLEINKTPSHADQLKGYLGKTRVRTKEGLLVVQPFHPMLFRQGPLPGPKLIMEYQRGEISDDNLEKAWGDAVENTQAVEKKFEKIRYPCGVCDGELLAKDFVFTLGDMPVAVKHVLTDVIALGSCRQCFSCKNRLQSGGGEILCMSCDTRKSSSAFAHKMWHSMWKQRSFTKAICMECSGRHARSTKQFLCTRCTKALPPMDFDNNLLNACLLENDFEKLHCPKCAKR